MKRLVFIALGGALALAALAPAAGAQNAAPTGPLADDKAAIKADYQQLKQDREQAKQDREQLRKDREKFRAEHRGLHKNGGPAGTSGPKPQS